MRIHRVASGERVEDIAEKYGIEKKILCLINDLEDDTDLSVGEELLILTPTRTYTAKDGDTMERIGFRFGQSLSELYALNPHITKNEVYRGQTVIIKRDERPYGMGASNGIFYRDCPTWKLIRALPYMTYITVSSGIFDGNSCSEMFDGGDIVKLATENGKLSLIRVFDKSDGKAYISRSEEYTDALIELAVRGGYKGIVLGYNSACQSDEYREFIVKLRKKMIGSDLILISEVNKNSKTEISDYSDGAILTIDKCANSNAREIPFAEYEEKALLEYADRCESTKTFIELPVFANSEKGGFINVEDAIYLARHKNAPTASSKSTKISEFKDKKYGSILYNSLSSIKSRLDLCTELGYMGISLDIARCPLSYLMMYDSLFKSIGYASVIDIYDYITNALK